MRKSKKCNFAIRNEICDSKAMRILDEKIKLLDNSNISKVKLFQSKIYSKKDFCNYLTFDSLLTKLPVGKKYKIIRKVLVNNSNLKRQLKFDFESLQVENNCEINSSEDLFEEKLYLLKNEK
jgi:hypothetical protein